jgi:hypothetical protein
MNLLLKTFLSFFKSYHPGGIRSCDPWTLAAMHTGCRFSVEGCFGARKQDMKIFISFHQANTGQLDRY